MVSAYQQELLLCCFDYPTFLGLVMIVDIAFLEWIFSWNEQENILSTCEVGKKLEGVFRL